MLEPQEPIENENQDENPIEKGEQSKENSSKEDTPGDELSENKVIKSAEADSEAENDEERSGEIDESVIGEDSTKLPSKSVPSEEDLRLSWLVDDYNGITENIYEAVIVAARRARQIGRRQKQEIDNLNSSMEVVDLINNEEEEGLEPGVDHFHHMKPTIQAMKELKNNGFTFSYPENLDDDDEENYAE